MATHSSILAWDIPWMEGTWQDTAHEVLRAGQDLATEQQQHGWFMLYGRNQHNIVKQ